MDACNHLMVSHTILKYVGDVRVTFNLVQGIVTDHAAYCKKAVRDVFSAVFPVVPSPAKEREELCRCELNV